MKFLILILALTLPLQDQIKVPAEIARAVRDAEQSGRDVVVRIKSSTKTAESTGAGGQAQGEKAELKDINQTAPSVGVDGSTASGGDNAFSAGAFTSSRGLRNPLIWTGILGLIAAGVAVYFQLRRLALVCGLGGAGLIVAALLPEWAVFLIAVLGAGAFVFFLWSEYQGQSHREALRAVVAGVQRAPEPVAKAVKAEISKQADVRDSAVIESIKIKDRLK